jgi:hypothetical protein
LKLFHHHCFRSVHVVPLLFVGCLSSWYSLPVCCIPRPIVIPVKA